MPTFMLTHRHRPEECRISFAAWRGFESPLRHRRALSSCLEGGHQLWWRVEAADREAALAQLPRWIAERTEASGAREVPIP